MCRVLVRGLGGSIRAVCARLATLVGLAAARSFSRRQREDAGPGPPRPTRWPPTASSRCSSAACTRGAARPYVSSRSRRCSSSRSSVSGTQFMLGLFAFGSLLAFTIAHVSVIALRYREPNRPSSVPRAVLHPGRRRDAADPHGAGPRVWRRLGQRLVLHPGARAPAGSGWPSASSSTPLPARPGQVAAQAFVIPDRR